MTRRFRKSKRELCTYVTRAGAIEYFLQRSSRRRTIEISVDDAMEIRVAAPFYTSEKEIQKFIQDKADWIVNKQAEARYNSAKIQDRRYQNGNHFLFLGKKHPLKVKEENIKQSRIAFDDNEWEVRVPFTVSADEQEGLVKDRLLKWYRQQAKEIFGSRIFHYARILNLHPNKIVVKTQKRIWGSCYHRDKVINLNWSLVLSPIEVIDYVVVHELCHLKVPNHSQRFWRMVEKVLPDYKIRQRWLKINTSDMVLP